MLAKVISIIFEPFVLFPVIAILVALRSGMAGLPFYYFLCVFMFGILLPPTILRYWAVKTKRITNWDISDRKQRIKAFIFLAILLCIDYVLILFFGNLDILRLMQLYILTFGIFYCITLFWKISGHLTFTVINLGIISTWYPQIRSLLFIIPPLLAWSRVKLKRHTIAQTVGGILFGGMMYEIWQRIF